MSRTQIDASLIQVSGIIPTGVVFDYAGTTVPSGFYELDGSVKSQTTDAALFAVCGTNFNTGGEGAGNFRLPNCQRRVVMGRGGSGTGTIGNAVGNTGGEENHTLTTAELAAHNHGVTDPGHNHGVSDPGHSHSFPFNQDSGDGTNRTRGCAGGVQANFSTNGATTGVSVNSNTTGISTQNNGSGTAHNNIQPAIILMKIIKY